MLTKEKFIKYIDILQKMHDRDLEIYNATNSGVNLIGIDEYSEFYGAYVSMLNDLMGLEESTDFNDLEYFIYELDFGREYTPGCVTLDDEIIDISTAEKLYDYIVQGRDEQ